MISIVSGSVRENSQSIKVCRYIEYVLKGFYGNSKVNIIDLAELQIPFWDEEFENRTKAWDEKWGPVSEQLVLSNGLIIVTPEWGGMVPPMLKNFFLLCGHNELGHKPALIVSISSGLLGGSYPIAELRTTSFKNNKICYIPEQIIIKEVKKYLNNNGIPDDEKDQNLRNRIKFCIDIFLKYVSALEVMRKDDALKFNYLYEFGM